MGLFSWLGSSTSAGIVDDAHLPPVEHRGNGDAEETVAEHPYAIEARKKAFGTTNGGAASSTRKVKPVDASPAAKKPAEVNAEASEVEEAIDNDDADAVTGKALRAYLEDKGVETPKSASKAALIKLAREASKSTGRSASATGSKSESRKRARSTSAKSEEPTPDATWTVAQLKAYAKKNSIKVKADAVKADILSACTE